MRDEICKDCALYEAASRAVCEECPHIFLTGKKFVFVFMVLFALLLGAVLGANYF